MANRYIFVKKKDPNGPDDVFSTVTGGTLNGASATLQVTWDDAVFLAAGNDKSADNKALILALEHLINFLRESSTEWPPQAKA